MKKQSVLYTNKIFSIDDQAKQTIIDDAKYWKDFNNKEVYDLMFSETITRSWFVNSSGSCPICKKDVPLYTWIIDTRKHKFKVKCPHCSELFPKNDYESYYTSGLDTNGKFHHESANSELLVNDENTDFCVDDGRGWKKNDKETYFFIAAYFMHGIWEKDIIEGIRCLSHAYLITKDDDYALKCGLLFHSISRFFKDFDYITQAWMYEGQGKTNGYVGYWVQSANDLSLMAVCYDAIFDSIKDNKEMEKFLGLSFSEIQNSIEENIFEDIHNNHHKIHSNPPCKDMALIFSMITLDWPNNKDEVMSFLEKIIIENTLIDGVVGEKGLSAYAAFSPRRMMQLYGVFDLLSDSFIDEIFEDYPQLYKTYTFHINTWYMNKYYPTIGDCGLFDDTSVKNPTFFTSNIIPQHSGFYKSTNWFLYKLYKIFKDDNFLKVLYINNNFSSKDLFKYEYLIDNSKELEDFVETFIKENGYELKQESINYEKWHLGILHSGKDESRRMISMLYDSGANHSHQSALDVKYFFKDRKITPGFGYPPVSYGGWLTDEVNYTRLPISHNIVVIDNREHVNMPPAEFFLRYPDYGTTILFEKKDNYQVMYFDAKEYANVEVYKRLIAMIDINEKESYIIDIFKVEGGNTHKKYQRSTQCTLDTADIKLEKVNDLRDSKFIKNYNKVINPSESTSFIFKDGFNFKYTDLTNYANLYTCESWIDVTRSDRKERAFYIPTVVTESKGPKSTFINVNEIYEKDSLIDSISRFGDEDNIELEVVLKDGTTQIITLDELDNFEICNL